MQAFRPVEQRGRVEESIRVKVYIGEIGRAHV